jgi:hypothetical protein
MGFIVGNEVYDHLEKVVDRFDDVANVMHGIVIEHVWPGRSLTQWTSRCRCRCWSG